ncbi:hypothetical protein GCM10011509_10240 [Ornithinimicrobium pekingense]|uniref:Cation efflux protein transmembrane domain-containing protein n=1 Tax=Ornithinimicrobium pekingense TaxID=384677 RepID=A0ABQ2F5R2_9MICO|nr:hypothetical protein GCM10011509_10240 [Ornithinimicrobium pekingense]
MSHGAHVGAEGDRRSLVISGWLTGGYFVVELVVGLWSGSVAVISDAFHTFSAVGGVLIALAAQALGQRPATVRETFGWSRAEILGALFNGLFLVLMAGYVFWMGAMRLSEPVEPPTSVMPWVAAGGIATEVVAFLLMYQRQKTSLNMKGRFLAHPADVRRQPNHRHLGARHQVHQVPGDRPPARDGVRTRAALGVLEHPAIGPAGPAPGDAGGVRHASCRQGAFPDRRGEGPAPRARVEPDVGTHGVFSAHLRVSDAAHSARVLQEATDALRTRFDVYFSTLQVEQECLDEQAASDIDITRTPPAQG